MLKILQEELTPMFLKLNREGILPNSFHEANITLMSKLDKETTKKKTVSQFP
jgi:hypothetical protein